MNSLIHHYAKRMEPLKHVPVIDAHGHLGHCSIVHAALGDAREIVKSMDSIGIIATAISAFQSLGGNVVRGNDAVAAAIQAFPGRFIGYGTVNPLFPYEVLREVNRCLDELGMWAIKIHPTMHANTAPDAPVYQDVYANLDERRGVVLSHTFGSPEILDVLSSRYPRVTFIFAHAGSNFEPELAHRLVPLMNERENVYIDTCLSVVRYGNLEKWVTLAGPDRLLFGSDVPFNDNAHQIGRVTHTRLPEADKVKILGQNVIDLLKRTGGWTTNLDKLVDLGGTANVE
ncbi:MAG: amidohydrolase family protein [Anaerolineae bacterium]|nr:amidohydrolase family protein [Anaerolineae bacterium]